MPVFDNIRINHSHIARVIAVKNERIDVSPFEEACVSSFNKWREHIKKLNKKGKNLLTTTVEHLG